MTLIKCPECNKLISNMSEFCPNCGYPYKNLMKDSKLGKFVYDIIKFYNEKEEDYDFSDFNDNFLNICIRNNITTFYEDDIRKILNENLNDEAEANSIYAFLDNGLNPFAIIGGIAKETRIEDDNSFHYDIFLNDRIIENNRKQMDEYFYVYNKISQILNANAFLTLDEIKEKLSLDDVNKMLWDIFPNSYYNIEVMDKIWYYKDDFKNVYYYTFNTRNYYDKQGIIIDDDLISQIRNK